MIEEKCIAPLAPVAIFAFNRPETLKSVLYRLSKCDKMSHGGGVKRPFYAFVDGPRNEADAPLCAEARTLLENFRKYMCPQLEITARERNLGNVVNMPLGIRDVLDRHGRIVIVEDDVIVSRHFLTYMDEALEVYEGDARIWCVNAYRHRFVNVPGNYAFDVYLNNRNTGSGWGTWRDRWSAVDMEMTDWPEFSADVDNMRRLDAAGLDIKNMIRSMKAGRLKAWDVQCSYHMAKNGLWAIEPRLRMTKNIGWHSGDHCSGGDSLCETMKYWNFSPSLVPGLKPDKRIVRQFPYTGIAPNSFARAYRRLLRIAMRFAPRNDEPLEVAGK